MKSSAIIRQVSTLRSARRLGPVVIETISLKQSSIAGESVAAEPLQVQVAARLAENVEQTEAQIEQRVLLRLRQALQDEAKEVKDAAYQEGLTQGKAAGEQQAREAALAKLESVRREAERVTQRIESALTARQEADEAAALELALAALVRVLGKMPDASLVEDLIRQAANELKGQEKVILRLAPADVDVLERAGVVVNDLLDGKVSVVTDSSMMGGCVLETERGELDARLTTQVQSLVAMLMRGYGKAEI